MSAVPIPAEQLVQRAREAKSRAYAPYSGFSCGAAVWADDEIFTGVNIENASYGLTCCAERVAIFQAVAAGKQEVQALALVTSDEQITPPCGACLQVIAEFASGDIPIVLVSNSTDRVVYRLYQLLPHPFRIKEEANADG